MDKTKIDQDLEKKGGQRHRILKIYTVTMICIVAFILFLSPLATSVEERAILSLTVFILFGVAIFPASYMILMHLLYHAGDTSRLIPSPVVTLEEEKIAAEHLFNKIFGNKILTLVVVPLLVGILIDVLTRRFVSSEVVSQVTFAIWLYIGKLLIALMFVRYVAARFYQAKSGTMLYAFTNSYAKSFVLFRKEVGVRKLALIAVLLLEVPFMFGIGWIFVTGIYLLIAKICF